MAELLRIQCFHSTANYLLSSLTVSFVMEGVKNLAVKKHNLPVTRIVDALMELKSSPEVDDYRYFDPKLVRATDNASIPRSRSPFQVRLGLIMILSSRMCSNSEKIVHQTACRPNFFCSVPPVYPLMDPLMDHIFVGQKFSYITS